MIKTLDFDNEIASILHPDDSQMNMDYSNSLLCLPNLPMKDYPTKINEQGSIYQNPKYDLGRPTHLTPKSPDENSKMVTSRDLKTSNKPKTKIVPKIIQSFEMKPHKVETSLDRYKDAIKQSSFEPRKSLNEMQSVKTYSFQDTTNN